MRKTIFRFALISIAVLLAAVALAAALVRCPSSSSRSLYVSDLHEPILIACSCGVTLARRVSLGGNYS